MVMTVDGFAVHLCSTRMLRKPNIRLHASDKAAAATAKLAMGVQAHSTTNEA